MESAILSDPIDFSRSADRLFDKVADKLTNAYRRRLLCEHHLENDWIEQIRLGAAAFLSVSMGSSQTIIEETELLARLMEKRSSMVNVTPNGLVVPKREHSVEFNLLHKAVAGAFAQFVPAEIVDSIQFPINLRIVEGREDSKRDSRPYATSKRHLDVWTGEPLDSITINLPVFGDPENITLDFTEMAPELELKWMKLLDDYAVADTIPNVVSYDDLKMRIGSVYFFDARLLHQTVRRRQDGFRISLDFRFRSKYRLLGEQGLGKLDIARLKQYIPYDAWLDVGKNSISVFTESCDEARTKYTSGARVAAAVPAHRIISMATQ